ncbi:BatD family protein [Thiomicrorhabdus heinhorstiae]|uniref:Protein BatD n=1 Tax=Thiomicrorhabdus heinhorstiae TaxID=2748010 RepID=A0ABS0BXK0_9GAMM|nr:BatD family protein [Thiomicrorhabdus heinhorstiae]MBF6057734.1 protein BatD [Thiomicrorhabdus heinhorstiae]
MNPRLNFRHLIILLIGTLLNWPVFADSVTVHSDRQTIEMGDILTVWIDTDFATHGQQPDLSVLEDQFQVLNSQQSNQLEIINGKMSARTRWQVELLPKQIGELMIPPIKVDSVSSQPYKIQVTKAAQTGSLKPYFMEATLDKKQAYVQEEVLYTLRFYYRGRLISGNVTPVEFGPALVNKIKDQAVFQKYIDGKPYTVYEWVYAFFPQASGRKTIPAVEFNGVIQTNGRQKSIHQVSKPQSLQVLASKQNPQNQVTWLPAQDLKLSATLEQPKQTLRVGDSLSRTLVLKATGLKSSQLVELKSADGDGFKLYAEPVKREESIEQNHVVSRLIQAQTLIFTKAGEITIPGQTLSWWNPQKHAFEEATLKPQTVEVLPAASQPKASDLPVRPVSTSVPRETPAQSGWLWPALSAVFAVLWLITLIYALKNRRPQPAEPLSTAQSESPPDLDYGDWCQMPAKPFYNELRKRMREQGLPNTSQLESPELKNLIAGLEAHLFFDAELPDDYIEKICRSFKPGKKKSKSSDNSQLAQLYGRAAD